MPLPPAPAPPDPPSDDLLHALAAGELPPAEAAALEGRLTEDPVLARRYEGIAALERALSDEALLPLPAGLTDRIAGGLSPRRARGGVLAGVMRAAAAVLAAFLAWLLATGALPTPARAAPAPAVENALRAARDLVPPLPTVGTAVADVGAPPVAAMALGLVLLIGGLILARRMLGRSDRRTGA
jgi:anti-sigma factor RsiW